MSARATLVPISESPLHFVLCDFGKLGQAYQETDPTEADRDTIVRDMLSGQYDRPLKVIELTPDGRWRDVSIAIADVVEDLAERQGRSLNDGTQEFVTAHSSRQVRPTKDLVSMMHEVARGVGNIS